jgi:glycosyltransferase involved in cell wall biosynthesis
VARDPATLVISGKMSYHANVSMVLHLVEKILPHVWRSRPDARLLIVGKDPTREIQALGEHPAITVTGTVPDLPPYLQRATVAVAPITYRAGIQNKILEAMATETPVVTTPAAVSALQVTPNQDLMVAAEPKAFAESVVSLLNDQTKRQAMGKAGRRFVETYHDWRAAARRLTAVYEDAIGVSQAALSPIA